jgi:hypothetical protein
MEPGFDGGPGSSHALNAALLVQQTIVAAKSRACFFPLTILLISTR